MQSGRSSRPDLPNVKVPKVSRKRTTVRKKAPQKESMWSLMRSHLGPKFLRLDKPIMGCLIGLYLFGALMVYSASAENMSGSAMQFFIKQMLFVCVSLGVLLVLYTYRIQFDRPQQSRVILTLLFLGVIVLMLIASFGPVINGARGWIPVPGIGIAIQPVEFLKPTLIMWFAYSYINDHWPRHGGHEGWFITVGKRLGYLAKVYGLPVITLVLLYRFPDMGGMGIVIAIIGTMFLTSGMVSKNWMIGAVALVGSGLFALYHYGSQLLVSMSDNYKIARLLIFSDPFADPDKGHQVVNSFYAINNGGLFGRGLGNSLQKHGALPEPNTDFIIAIISEELGLVTVLAILGVFGFLLARMLYYGTLTANRQYRLILNGASAYLLVQVVLNIGGAVSVVPLTGVTAPFLSYGGSSLLSWGITFGLVLNVISCIKREME